MYNFAITKKDHDCHLPDYQMIQNHPWHWQLDSQSFCSWHLSGQRWPFEREICKFHFTSIVFRPGSISNFTKHIVCIHFPKPQWPPSKHGSCRAQIKNSIFLLLQNLWWETHHASSTEECIQMSAYEKSIKNCISSCKYTPMQRLTCELLGQLIAVLHLFAFWGCCWNQEDFFWDFLEFRRKRSVLCQILYEPR